MEQNQSFERLVEIMRQLRDQCPWDQKQTFETLKAYLIEEAYEVIEAIEEGSFPKIKEELGDLLFQIIFQSELACREGQFTIWDVIYEISEKMVRRHPHVFGDLKVKDADEVVQNWGKLKAAEGKQRSSVLDGVPRQLPALLRAQRLSDKAASTGFDWNHPSEILAKADEELFELKEAVQSQNTQRIEEEIGDMLFVIVNLARFLHISAEDALGKMIQRFVTRFHFIEQSLGERIYEAPIEEMERLWQAAKMKEGHNE